MKIENNSVVRFHYTVSEPGGEAIESSREQQPIAALIGHSGIIRGLEAALIGRAAGDTFQVDVTAEDAYGERRDDLLQRVPKKFFRDAARLRPGMMTVLNTRQGPRPVTVHKVGMSVVDVDLNHPMAGKALRFDIEVVDVRESTPEERDHGHVHGEGGVQHAASEAGEAGER